MNDIALSLHDVQLRRGSRAILAGVTFRVRAGEIIAVMGQSGSGKTTMLRAIAGLETFDAGAIDVNGVQLAAGSIGMPVIRRLRSSVGMVFQFHCLFDHLTTISNVTLAPIHAHGVPTAEAERRGRELLSALGVEHRASALPRELSGGEAQRVAIARALAVDPPVLLMDEPTASLDAARRMELAAVLRQLVSRNRTLLIATHDEEFARAVATRVLRLTDGVLQSESP
jgi:ABC-type polar amino acid transport system ATPase subunit